jgi:hypothetical protein
MIKNINPYNKTEFKQFFEQTEIYKKIEQNFGKNNLIWEKNFNHSSLIKHEDYPTTELTPRSRYRYFSMSTFYYLLPLLENNYDTIYDLGCGKNMFKPYLPRLLGVGAEKFIAERALLNDYHMIKDQNWPNITGFEDFENLPDWIKEECAQKKLDISEWPYRRRNYFYGDVDGFVNESYVLQHQNYFQSVFSICALHFHPLTKFKKIISDFVSMIRPGGCGFLSLNLQRMIEKESNLLKLFSTDTPTALQYDEYLRNELSNFDLNFLILDIDLTLLDEWMDGNIRLVIKK